MRVFPRTGGRQVAKKPRISVVIPVYNEAPCLSKLYDELAAVCDPLPYEFEFLFVNDGSTDETEEVMAELRHGSTGPLPGDVSKFRASGSAFRPA